MNFRGSSAVSPQGANYRSLNTYKIYGYIPRRLIWINVPLSSLSETDGQCAFVHYPIYCHEGREKAIMVETDMEFDGGFCCTELRSGEAAQAQVNGGGVKGIQLVFKPEAVARCNNLASR